MIKFDKPLDASVGTSGVVEVYLGVDDQWYWRAKASNGQKVAQGEGFPRRIRAQRSADGALAVRFRKDLLHPVEDSLAMVQPWGVIVRDRQGKAEKTGWLY